MKNKILLLILLSLSSCTNDIEEQQAIPSVLKSVTMIAKDFEYDKQCRTNFIINTEGAGFSWAENDTVGIFPNEGAQAYFPMVEGAGTKTATFTGGGWALKSSSTYAAYYPFIGNIYLDKTQIPVNYEGQTQIGNASTAHLGKYDFMAAVAKTPEQGKVNFNFEHLGCLMNLEVNTILPKVIDSVTLFAERSSFLLEGYLDLNSPKIGLEPTVKIDSLKIMTQRLSTTSSNLVASIYFMMAPVNLAGKNLTAIVSYKDGTTRTIHLIGKDFIAGKAYKLTNDPSCFIPENCKISYIPKQIGIPDTLKYNKNIGLNYVTLEYSVSPSSVLPNITEYWKDVLFVEGSSNNQKNPKALTVTGFKYNETTGKATVAVNMDGLDDSFYQGESNLNISLTMADGERSVISGPATVTAKKILTDFNKNNYLLYTTNRETIYSGDDIYVCCTTIDCPTTIYQIEMKYKMLPGIHDIRIPLLSSNMAKYDYYYLSLDKNYGFYIMDYNNSGTLGWEDSGVSMADETTLFISFTNKKMRVNQREVPMVLPNCDYFISYNFFADYFRENDEGIYKCSDVIPEGSRMYYVKLWDEQDNLVYIGYPSKGINPKTEAEEFCWRSYYAGKESVEFPYYPKDGSKYKPFGFGTAY